MKRLTIYGILTASIVICASVYAGVVYYQGGFPWQHTDDDVIILDDAMNTFAFELYQKIRATTDENLFFSPYSIYIALGMTFEGANGTTAEEMTKVLGYSPRNETMLSVLGYLWDEYNTNEAFNLSTANALWLRQGFALLDSYLATIATYYRGNVTEMDVSKPVETAAMINSWVENQTNGKIKDLISPAFINSNTALILTNAIYFKGMWEHPFDTNMTQTKGFEVAPGEYVNVPMMQIEYSEHLFNYTETETMQVLELPYKGDKLSMLVLLPKEHDLSTVEQIMDVHKLKELKNSLEPKEIDIYLPQFKFETDYDLNDMLIAMGMPTAFTPSADFSGIDGIGSLFIYKVLHKAFIEVNEEGTEAAAATAVIMMETALPGGSEQRLMFNANHPFLFIIQHKETGNILFMGNVMNPLE